MAQSSDEIALPRLESRSILPLKVIHLVAAECLFEMDCEGLPVHAKLDHGGMAPMGLVW